MKAYVEGEGLLIVASAEFDVSEGGENPVFLQCAGIPAQGVAEHLFALCLAFGLKKGDGEIHEQGGIVLLKIGLGRSLREEFPGLLGIALAECLGLGPKKADLHRAGPLFFGFGILLLEPREELAGLLRAPIQAAEGGKKIVHRADRRVVAEVENGLAVEFTGFLGLFLLAPIPPEIADGTANTGGAGILIHKLLH